MPPGVAGPYPWNHQVSHPMCLEGFEALKLQCQREDHSHSVAQLGWQWRYESWKLIGSSEYVEGTTAGCQSWKVVTNDWLKIVCLISKLKTWASFLVAFPMANTRHPEIWMDLLRNENSDGADKTLCILTLH